MFSISLKDVYQDVYSSISADTKKQVGVGLGAFLVSAYLIKKIRQLRYNLPSGPYPLPLLGNLLEFRGRKGGDIFISFKEKYGDACTIYIGPETVVLLNSIELIREAYIQKGADVSERPLSFTAESFTEGYKDVAFGMYSDPVWKLQRKIIHTALRVSGPDDPFFSKICKLVDEINIESGNGLLPDYFPLLRYFPLPSVRLFKKKLNIIQGIFSSAWQEHVSSFDPDDIRDFSYQLIQIQKQAELMDDESAVLAQFTETHFRQILSDLFFAGTDTTRLTLSWIIQYMAMYQDVQIRVQKEIDSVCGSGKMPNLADRPSLPYTEAVMWEVMRMKPVAGVALPHKTLNDVTIGEYRIPRGTQVWANIYSLMFDTRYFKDPEKFNPNRFLGPDGKVNRPEAMIPFSTGKRACPGEHMARNEIQIIMACIFQRYSVEPPPGVTLTGAVEGIALSSIPVPYEVVFKQRS